MNKPFVTGKIGCNDSVGHDTYEEAIAWIDDKISSDPDGVLAGDYYIDAEDCDA